MHIGRGNKTNFFWNIPKWPLKRNSVGLPNPAQFVFMAKEILGVGAEIYLHLSGQSALRKYTAAEEYKFDIIYNKPFQRQLKKLLKWK